MPAAQSRATGGRNSGSPGVIGALLGFVVRALFWLLVSLFLSIVVEWIGLTFWWPEAGIEHSLDMYRTEIGYLATDLRQSLVFEEPGDIAAGLAEWIHGCWRRSGLLDLITWMAQPVPSDASAFRHAAHGLHDYAAATVFITMVFAVRLAILTFAMPVFLMVGLVGLVDGLVERDVRRFSGGRESAYVFHWAKTCVTPMLLLTWAIYLAMPISVHPAFVVLPFAILFAFALRIAAASFKKYL